MCGIRFPAGFSKTMSYWLTTCPINLSSVFVVLFYWEKKNISSIKSVIFSEKWDRIFFILHFFNFINWFLLLLEKVIKRIPVDYVC